MKDQTSVRFRPRTPMRCFVSLFLAVLFVFYSFPAQAFGLAENIELSEDTAVNAEKNVGSDLLSADGAYEILPLREENVKHFRLPDGSMIAAQYDTAVHYRDEDGAWQDIDNTLSYDILSHEYKTENGYTVAFPLVSGGETLLALRDGARSFSFSLEEAVHPVSADVENPTTTAKTVRSYKTLSALENLTSRIRYTDIMDGVDVEYVLLGDRIYENIILKTPTADTSYTFRLKMEGLTLSVDEGTLVLSDKENGEEVFVIPASFMTDSTASALSSSAMATENASLQSTAVLQSYSEDVSYSVTQDGEDVLLTVSASNAWLTETERVYPVTVDPPVFSGGVESTVDTYVSSLAPYDAAGQSAYLWVGRFADQNNVTQETVSFWKATSFPTLPAGSSIVSATLLMQQNSLELEESVWGGIVDSAIVVASYLDGDFNNDTTWQTAPDIASTVLDYATAPTADENGLFFWSWDIGKAVEAWMSGDVENNGICLSMYGTVRNVVSFYSSEAYPTEENQNVYVPTLAIQYRSALGLDALYSYSSFSTPAGTAYIGDAMGSVTLVSPTVSSQSALWAYTPSLVYRSQRASHTFFAEFEDGETLPLKTGGGFMADFEEAVYHVYMVEGTDEPGVIPTIAQNYYVWIDSDGTEHRFEARSGSTTVYQCEEDETLTLTVQLGHYKLKSEKSEAYTLFDSADGKLLRRVDENGNALCFAYNADGYVNAISLLPAGKAENEQISLFTVTYQNGLLAAITSVASGQSFSLVYNPIYSPAVIDSMHWSDHSAFFMYDSPYGRITSITDVTTADGVTVAFTYDGVGRVCRLESYAYENGTELITGQTVSMERRVGQAIYRTAGTDDVHGNTDDLLTTYVFDTSCRTVRAYTTNLDGTVFYGGSGATYTAEEDEKTASEIYTHTLPLNLLPNGSFETGALSGWSSDESLYSSYAEHGTAAVVTANAFEAEYGAYRLKLSTESYMSGEANATRAATLDAGSYTFSARIKSDTDSSTGVEAYLAVISPAGVKKTSARWSKWDNGSDEWRLYTVNFTVESAGTYRFVLVLETAGGAGYAYFDNALLVAGSGTPSMTYIQNGDAETLDAWGGSGRSLSSDALTGEKSFSLSGDIGAKRSVSQTVLSVPSSVYAAQSTVPHQTYLLTAWAKADSVPLKNNTTFALVATATYYDIVTRKTAKVEYRASYNAGASDWQMAEISIALTKAQMAKTNLQNFDANAALSNQLLIGLSVSFEYDYNANTAYFDHIALVYDESAFTSYEYDGENLSSVTLPDGKQVTYSYTDAEAPHQPTSVTAVDGSVYTFVYNEKQRITQSGYTSPDGGYQTVTDYTYDAYGNVTATELGAVGTDEVFYSSSRYETESGITFGALLDTTDYLGNTTRNLYDAQGRLSAVLLPDGTGTAYTYDTHGRTVAVIPILSSSEESESFVTGAGEVSYTYYADGSVATITTASTVYSFTYDVFGNRTATYADGNLLASYAYAPNNGKLLSVSYGNGFTVSYTYDALDRMASVRYNNGSEIYSYAYDVQGNLASHTDVLAGYTYRYVYDLRGRVTEAYAEPLENGRTAYRLAYHYDEDDRVTQTDLVIGDASYAYIPTYDADGVIQSYTYVKVEAWSNTQAAFADATYTYDAFGRLTVKEIDFADNASFAFRQSYDYTTRTVNGKTYTGTQIKEYSYATDSGSTYNRYRYEYDANGRITKIYWTNVGGESFILQKEYEYDAKGQLVYEHNVDLSDGTYYMGDAPYDDTVYTYAYRYTYDDAGNMLTKSEIAMVKDALTGTYSESHVTKVWYYTYGAALADGNLLGDALAGIAVVANPIPSEEATPTYSVITYDAVGNPLTYQNASGSYSFTWTNGRQLASVTKNGVTTTYTYNKDGIRTSKTVNGVRHDYILNGSTILAELWTEDGVSYGLYFTYDESGSPFTMEYRAGYESELYHYATDAFGKITGVLDANGTHVIRYIYDAYGNVTTKQSWSDQAGIPVSSFQNPFLYNGYYYDAETGFYYCNSRYYDPQNARFVNADGQLCDDIRGNNLFIYCGNDPVNRVDSNGEFWWVVSAAVGAVVAGVAQIVSNVATGQNWSDGLVGAMAGGAVSGAIMATTGNLALASYAGAATESFFNEAASYIPVIASFNGEAETKELTIENVSNSINKVAVDTMVNGTVNMLTGKMTEKIIPSPRGDKPQKLAECIKTPYAKKSYTQTLVQNDLILSFKYGTYLAEKGFQGCQKIVAYIYELSKKAVNES